MGTWRAMSAGEFQERLNRSFWSRGTTVRAYANRVLRPVEVVLIALHRDALRGRVLELGSGGGRLTGYLAALGGSVTGLDVAPAMVDHGRRAYPEARFVVGDLRELEGLGEGAFDVVFASFNVLDVLGHEERLRVLGDIRRLLAPGGLLIMSSHNLATADRRRRPTRVIARSPLRMAANVALLPRRVRNRRRLRPAESTGPDHAVLNDEAHDFGLLHYYIEPDGQARQLESLGFEVLERRDLDGRLLPPGERAPWSVEVHYVARRP
jgi:SAM-dependent methyltransferase